MYKNSYHPLTCFLAFCLFLNICKAQEPVLKSYSSSQGLISNETYDLLRDSRGFIWVATELGVSRFDGTEFVNFNASNGMPDQVVIKLYEDEEGRIWFNTMSGKLSYWENGKIKTYQYNNIISKYIVNRRYPPIISVHGKDSLVVHIFGGDNILITPNGEVLENYLTKIHQIKSIRKEYEIFFDKYNYYLFSSNNGSKTISITANWNNYKYPIPPTNAPYNNITVRQDHNGNYLLSSLNSIHRLENDGSVTSYANNSWDISSFMISAKNRKCYIGNYKQGLMVYDNLGDKSLKLHVLKGKHVTGIVEDHQGGVWVSTYKNGVYYLPNFHLYKYFLPEGFQHVSALQRVKNDMLIVGLSNGEVWLLDPNAPKLWTPLIQGYSNHCYTIFNKEDEIWCVLNNYTVILDEKLQALKHLKIVGKCIIENSNKSQVLIGGLGLFEVAENNKINLILITKRIEYLHALPNGEIWAGNPSGLWQLLPKEDTVEVRKFNGIERGVSGIESIGGQLYVATKGEGLALVSGQQINWVNERSGLSNNNIRLLKSYKDYLWVVHDKGIDVFQAYQDTTLVMLQSWQLNVELPGNNISSLEVMDSTVWLGTDNGLYSMNLNRINEGKQVLYLYIEGVNNNEEEIRDNLLQPYNNNLSFDFTALNYSNLGTQKYRSRLIGLDSNWAYSSHSNVNYRNLPPGNYQFEVQAAINNREWSKSSFYDKIVISKPVNEQLWFRLLFGITVVLIIGFIGYAFTQLQLRKEKEQNNNKLNALELELTALRAQMNPHFTFNTLNSIQHYILLNEPIKASDYLAKFSKLIRKLLDNARTSLVPIADEVSAITSYLELEQIRLDHAFTYTLEIDRAIDLNKSLIPSAMIQPFVENSIWHGLAYKTEPGYINISVTKVNSEKLQCVIEDNGVGRSFHEGKKSKARASLGLKIIKERLSLLKEVYQQNYKYQIEDLIDERSSSRGTRVTVEFPLLFKNNII